MTEIQGATGLVLDAGALIAVERADRRMVAILIRAQAQRAPLVVPAGALAQVWRDGRRQVRLARLLAADALVVEPLDSFTARAAGQLLGVRGTTDVVDAQVALCARRHGLGVATSDPDDLARLDPTLRLVKI